jgi:hypothetical protein
MTFMKGSEEEISTFGNTVTCGVSPGVTFPFKKRHRISRWTFYSNTENASARVTIQGAGLRDHRGRQTGWCDAHPTKQGA